MSSRRRISSLPAVLTLAALAAMAVAVPAEAALRCGTRLVNEGDSASELFARCGEPTAVDRKTVLQPPIIWRYGRPVRVGGGAIEVQVEFWTYNLGPNKLMRRIRIEDGRVKSIETLGYGYL